MKAAEEAAAVEAARAAAAEATKVAAVVEEVAVTGLLVEWICKAVPNISAVDANKYDAALTKLGVDNVDDVRVV